MQPECLTPSAWLAREPLKPAEQLFAIFSNASDARPPLVGLHPIWADTIYAEWDAVMPFVGVVAADSAFLDWVASTESRDWGWLAVSSASLEVVVEHFRSLTQVLMPDGAAVFFRFWDGRFVLPILQSDEVQSAQLMPVISRGLINGQAVEIGGRAQVSGRVFPWWKVTGSVLAATADDIRIGNAVQWLSEEHPALFEAFPEPVLRCKVRRFFHVSASEETSQSALLDHLQDEAE
ncbi:DUF4123 domain-containing protein [Pseudomonas sp. Y5-11]|uniref:DUF4123 domain-containing protein n=1 Tax=Pseudomonas sp. Y5-11 TaxID=2749808 RepID=UPI001EFAEA61|nr:DUF4123 domain-containing protein [Pseudomonas sp. Y5-11]ULN81797.1 DUF4123 domain-containing protein [Pseudomonas sp. Y5-11]